MTTIGPSKTKRISLKVTETNKELAFPLKVTKFYSVSVLQILVEK